ncbi:MAG: non-canonical purine NTP pyrophosphatase, partial [Dehalococcoidia bacterium]|nr:non-canonical purine NTP pyrophosphatase [Dehalococcoidia bacterium]
TGNPAKHHTLKWLLEGLPLSPVTPGRLGLRAVPRERGDTHEAIARAKAWDWSRAASALAIASDGGLVLPALGAQWDSRRTHWFAGPAADDAQRVSGLLDLIRPYRGAQREASWVEAVAIADRGKVLASWELRGATGVIAEDPGETAQATGFWAFSVWYFPQFGKTYNQLSLEEREALHDHWARLRGLVQDFFHGYAITDGG